MTSENESRSEGSDTARRFCEDFGAALRAEGVSLRSAAERSGWGKSTIATATRGPSLPNLQLVVDVLTSLGKGAPEIDSWRVRHDKLLTPKELAPGSPPDPGGGDESVYVIDAPQIREKLLDRRVLVLAALVLSAVVAAVLIVVLNTAPADRTIIVQNKVAYGPSTLTEDRSPSYLGAQPIARCANQPGCKLAGTEVGSGAALDAICQLQGDLVTNANLRTTTLRQNPNVSASSLWYGVRWPDERVGYISEVYVAPQYRGGLQLPSC